MSNHESRAKTYCNGQRRSHPARRIVVLRLLTQRLVDLPKALSDTLQHSVFILSPVEFHYPVGSVHH